MHLPNVREMFPWEAPSLRSMVVILSAAKSRPRFNSWKLLHSADFVIRDLCERGGWIARLVKSSERVFASDYDVVR